MDLIYKGSEGVKTSFGSTKYIERYKCSICSYQETKFPGDGNLEAKAIAAQNEYYIGMERFEI